MRFPSLRRRVPVSPTVAVPGLARFPMVPGSLAQESVAETLLAGFYHFHLGDVITNGASNWALDPSHDTPLSTIWGNGVLRRANAFHATSPQIVYAHNAAPYDAIRGMIFAGIAPEKLGGVGSFNG